MKFWMFESSFPAGGRGLGYACMCMCVFFDGIQVYECFSIEHRINFYFKSMRDINFGHQDAGIPRTFGGNPPVLLLKGRH